MASPRPRPVAKRFACSPPCPYSFVASEARRPHDFPLDRAQVRRWAIENNLAHAAPPQKIRSAVRRWQRAQLGELWQLDASPHRYFPMFKLAFPMLNMLDDCSRVFTGSKLYERELLLAYFDFLPAYFASEKITELTEANRHIDALRHHHNAKETHRELRQTSQQAWAAALKEKRSVLRTVPACPWWPYVWSQRTTVRVGDDGRVSIGTQRLRIEKPPGTKVILCLHPTGHHSVLTHPPDPRQKPAPLFTNQPK